MSFRPVAQHLGRAVAQLPGLIVAVREEVPDKLPVKLPTELPSASVKGNRPPSTSTRTSTPAPGGQREPQRGPVARFRRSPTMDFVATDPIELERDDLADVVSRTRRALEARGELRPPVVRPFVSPLDDEERAAVFEALSPGAYERAVAEIAAHDPDLGDP